MAFSLRKVASLGPRTWYDLVLATIELALARVRVGTQTTQCLLGSPGITPTLSDAQRQFVDRVSFALPRVGAHVPWRADCLVQAVAAKRWLARHGILTSLQLGVRKQPSATFDAHAWLMVGDIIVTGGDVTGYVPLLASDDSSL